ncbi:MAG TPA: 4-(cytidine 5'-diphospho)-2-C-methyl-D-erythritol kinase [Spirochaetota bacterium]|nr:4-(cytidine 5'-diphospho)-2-C-methyl-D-erythritol kinase [Spirochaetota bacterium]HPC40136.1 4-(cytidine 5'-diphospho)-2-C-methyl-D-erythritol kinase [Spirochaetota bacterium]HPL16429.1 4-(cytidine 5'-diphospho)-2-C-methyl-D-erythritol kinase [Spirochaetota bacterium]HQF08540.1 4-(cytidine 5'-diphospho)-2-C-methyl-D-erythritol kinase [Spirochaetota bacterium]HQH97223.1 4-(cytidine 5'-diphospho)-2-C-methyl-D-erythritol kinase [Spirochaetota bacterium]
MTDSIRAHAKVNLHLEVLNRRDDGYHNIVSLMASVALHDLLKLEESSARELSGGIDIAIAVKNGGGVYGSLTDSIPAHENLIARAATLYYERAGINGRAVFSVEKNIPAGAGLGGGSSDAAAALKLLNGRFGKFRDDELADLGSKIGADVPYCLHGGFAIGRGIGELIMPVPGKLPPWVLIINDAIHVDTGAAYRSLNRGTEADAGQEAAVGRTIRRLTSALSKGSLNDLKDAAENDFEKPVFRQYPRIRHIKEELYGSGAAFAIMTGSGSSVIGLFQQKETAEQARSKLAGTYREVILTQFVQ